MGTKTKILLISVSGILLLLIVVLISLISVRVEFTKYLNQKYSDLSFAVGVPKIDPIYGRFFSNVTCMNDDISFPITKSFKTKEIFEDYPQYKSRIQYNSKIKSIFDSSDIKSCIRSVTGGGKIPFQNDGVYTQINFYLTDEIEAISVAKKVLFILKENHVSAERIIFTYENGKHVYEILLSSDDYGLTEKELESKVQRIK